jgi:glyoxylase-like metal-dependent hydrolase (beta-lactamase superfamily II)
MPTLLPAPAVAPPNTSITPVVADVARLRVIMVNVYFIGQPGDRREWILVDAGMPRSASAILRAAEVQFGAGARPRAIILTHGHFDHVGALPELGRLWPEVPIYAHPLEIPYIQGRSSYPPPDPTVGGGLMTRLSPLYPKGPYDFGENVFALPEDGKVPGMPGWQWVPTPGHSPGHVSLFRESDRTLIAGDAIVTTRQESALAVLTQRQELHGPPMYFTCDWQAAEQSVRRLADLQPVVAATGHGVPMSGSHLRKALDYLTRHFRDTAVPRHGRYVHQPAVTNHNGIVSLPPRPSDPVPKLLIAGALGLGVLGIGYMARRSRARERRY